MKTAHGRSSRTNGQLSQSKERLSVKVRLFWAALALSLLASCASAPDVVGRWREIGKSATLEFRTDGTLNAVDNQGMAVKGKYTLDEKGSIRVEITHEGSSPEIVNGKVSVQDDELTFEFTDHNAVERYKREK